jgi:TRAP-type C4-dicarboxylate transport system substrate-binding protein
LFLISSRGKIIQMLESWNREAWEDLSAQIARELKTAPVQIVRPEDEAAASMPG